MRGLNVDPSPLYDPRHDFLHGAAHRLTIFNPGYRRTINADLLSQTLLRPTETDTDLSDVECLFHLGIVRYAQSEVKRDMGETHTVSVVDRGMIETIGNEPSDRLIWARTNRGFSDAAEACRFFGFKYDTYIQHERGERGITRAADRYASAYRVSKAWLLTGEGSPQGTDRRMIPVVGHVGAGGLWNPWEQTDFGEIPSNIENEDALVAVRIKGDSMGSHLDGWYAIYDDVRDPPTLDLVGQTCVVWTKDDRAMVKILRRGSAPGLWTLYSGFGSPIEDVEVRAVAPVKRYDRGW